MRETNGEGEREREREGEGEGEGEGEAGGERGGGEGGREGGREAGRGKECGMNRHRAKVENAKKRVLLSLSAKALFTSAPAFSNIRAASKRPLLPEPPKIPRSRCDLCLL